MLTESAGNLISSIHVLFESTRRNKPQARTRTRTNSSITGSLHNTWNHPTQHHLHTIPPIITLHLTSLLLLLGTAHSILSPDSHPNPSTSILYPPITTLLALVFWSCWIPLRCVFIPRTWRTKDTALDGHPGDLGAVFPAQQVRNRNRNRSEVGGVSIARNGCWGFFFFLFFFLLGWGGLVGLWGVLLGLFCLVLFFVVFAVGFWSFCCSF